MQELHAALVALQDIDDEIATATRRVKAYAPQLETLLAPATAAERELTSTTTRLDEMRTEFERLQKNAEQKEVKQESYYGRLEKARTKDDESMLHMELDLVRGALEADRDDLKRISDQITRTDLKVDELERTLAAAREAVAEEQATVEAERDAAQAELDLLLEKRENHAVRLDQKDRRLYERVRGQYSRRVVSPMTEEGACGNCFNILPLQEQAEVRRGESLHRCEGCGVILYVA
ncbi:hypothetical protein BH23GEM10_BH23GEM10_14380 [soil metagenome]